MLFVLERADERVLAIEARDQLLRLLCAHAELERERARTLAGKRREVDDLADLALGLADRFAWLLEHGHRGLDVDVLAAPEWLRDRPVLRPVRAEVPAEPG